MNIFWIGLIVIIIFLFYQYRKLEQKYIKILDNRKSEDLDTEKILKKIFKIESELQQIKKEMNKG
jgi:hypothetical protein